MILRTLAAFFVCTLLCFSSFAQPPGEVGYASVQKAYDALRADPGAKGGLQGGWMIVSVDEGVNQGVWSFTPKEHPAHPAVVRRIPKEKDGQLYVDMRVLCGAEKAACDRLVADFKDLNERMAEEIKKRREKN